MLTYCLKCQKNTENIDPKILKLKNGRTMLSSKCAVCGSKKSRNTKEQEAKEVLSNLDLKTPLSKIPLLDDILFYIYCFKFIKCNDLIVLISIK